MEKLLCRILRIRQLRRRHRLNPNPSPSRCRGKCHDPGETVECNHQLWATTVSAQIRALTTQRKNFLAMKRNERGQCIYDAISFPPVTDVHAAPQRAGPRPKDSVIYTVGNIASRQRRGCAHIFRAHFPRVPQRSTARLSASATACPCTAPSGRRRRPLPARCLACALPVCA
eukprot:3837366-Pleurochrysis_carterae.AAC.5